MVVVKKVEVVEDDRMSSDLENSDDNKFSKSSKFKGTENFNWL